MNNSNLQERTINGRSYVLRQHEHINQHPDSNFLGTGLALVGELFGTSTLEDFIERQALRNKCREVVTNKPLSERKSATNHRPRKADAKSGSSYVPTGAKKGRPK